MELCAKVTWKVTLCEGGEGITLKNSEGLEPVVSLVFVLVRQGRLGS